MEIPPQKKGFWLAPFIVQITRGVLRDERARRKTMGLSLLAALAMLVAGLTVLRPWLNPNEHPWRFICFWLICAWETLLMLLLALLDLLLIRSEARRARRTSQGEFSKMLASELPNKGDETTQRPLS
jgi:hypothetical protein